MTFGWVPDRPDIRDFTICSPSIAVQLSKVAAKKRRKTVKRRAKAKKAVKRKAAAKRKPARKTVRRKKR